MSLGMDSTTWGWSLLVVFMLRAIPESTRSSKSTSAGNMERNGLRHDEDPHGLDLGAGEGRH